MGGVGWEKDWFCGVLLRRMRDEGRVAGRTGRMVDCARDVHNLRRESDSDI